MKKIFVVLSVLGSCFAGIESWAGAEKTELLNCSSRFGATTVSFMRDENYLFIEAAARESDRIYRDPDSREFLATGYDTRQRSVRLTVADVQQSGNSLTITMPDIKHSVVTIKKVSNNSTYSCVIEVSGDNPNFLKL